ncbi:MAG: diacylglycerol kinase family protein [Anaerolineales bacterium]
MSAYVILNPYANRWKAKERLPEVRQALESTGIDYHLVESDAPNHAIQLAASASSEGFSPIIAAGGDGTISEVVNGLYQASEGVLGPFGVLPLGTANDLVVNLGLPTSLQEAAQVIAEGGTRRIDLGQVNEWIFDNNSAVGLEPVVTIYNIRMTWLKGVIRYLVAALRAIADKACLANDH